MNACVIGMGQVGLATTALLCRAGHTVIGYDIHADKRLEMREGRFSSFDSALNRELYENIKKESLIIADDLVSAARFASTLFLCVPTPVNGVGLTHDITALQECIASICENFPHHDNHIIVIRSTVSPNQVQQLNELMTSKTATTSNSHSLVVNPEFLRERHTLTDIADPDYIVIGANDMESAEIVACFYGLKLASVNLVTPVEAAFVKIMSNAFHAMKTDFANEVAALCQPLGASSEQVMSVLVKDTKLNISKSYLRPGFAFGGTCLPKDISSLLALGEDLHIETPLISNLLESNQETVRRTHKLIGSSEKDTVLILGCDLPRNGDLLHQPFLLLLQLLANSCGHLLIEDITVPQSLKSRISKTVPQLEWLDSPSIPYPKIVDIVVRTSKVSSDMTQSYHFSGDKRTFDLNEMRYIT